MSSVACEFSTAETCVFWDLEYCPVPPGLSPRSIFDNIRLALDNMGYTGMLTIVAYSLGKVEKKDFQSAGIKILQLENRGAKREKMFEDFFIWGIDHRSVPTNVMVISRDITGDKNYCEGLLDLELNKNNVLLAFPEMPSELLPRYPSSVWLWASLAAGKRPLSLHKKRGKYARGRKRRANTQADETTQEMRKTSANTQADETMSSVACDFSTAHTGIFWDLDDCPVPPGVSPGSIFDNIKLALNNKGCTGPVGIVAYSLGKLKEKDFTSAGIKIVRLENLHAKHFRIYCHVSTWGLKYRLTNVMVISRDIFDDNDFVAALLCLKEKEHNVLLALPDEPSRLLCRVSTSHWLWSSLSSGGSSPRVVTPSHAETGSSLCVSCKKQMKPLHKKRGKTGKGRKRSANPHEDKASKKRKIITSTQEVTNSQNH